MLNNSVKKFIAKLAGPRVSLDYNNTFTTNQGKQLAQRLITTGNDVYIVSRLNDSARSSVEKAVRESGLNIPSNKIHFTNGALKYNTLRKLGIRTHYDNNQNEIDAIKKNTPEIKGIKF
jgi:hypothetical protein